jgi:outer membrane protein TolC
MFNYLDRWSRYVGGILALLWLAGWGQPPGAVAGDLTLRRCIDLAVAHDPEAKNALQKVDIGRLKLSRARQEFLPKVDLYFTYGPQTDYYGRPVTDKNVYYSGVGLEQPLYKGGTLLRGLRLAESETRRQEWEYRARALTVAAEAIQSYYKTLSAQAVILQYEALLRQGEEDLREAQSRQAAGTGTRLEVLELSVKLLEVQQRLSKARAAFQVELSNLKKITGIKDDERVSLACHYPLQDIQSQLEQICQDAQANRPDLKYAQEDVVYNQLRTEIEQGKRWPQLSLVARQEWESPEMVSGKKDWLVMLKASVSLGNTTMSYSEARNELYPNPYAYPTPPGYPGRTYAFSVRQWKYSIFDKSSNRVELEEARAARDLSHDRKLQLHRQIYYEIKDALAQKQDSEARMATAKQQTAMAQELLNITRTKHGVGYATLSDVFKARAALAEAQVNVVTAHNDQAASLGKLYKALGREIQFRDAGP